MQKTEKLAVFFSVLLGILAIGYLAQDPAAGGPIVLLSLLLGGYFLPVIVAAHRGHHQLLAIGALDLLLGWTVLGWVGAMVWACTEVHRGQVTA